MNGSSRDDMMNCEAAREEFSALLDGELTPEARAAVEAHLCGCSECLRRLEGYRRVNRLYADLDRVAAPSALEARVRGELQPVAFQSLTRVSRRSVLPYLASAAALLLMIGGAWQLFRSDTTQFEMASAPAMESTDAPAPPADTPEVRLMQKDDGERLNTMGYGDSAVEPIELKAKGVAPDPAGDSAFNGVVNRSAAGGIGGNLGGGGGNFGGGGGAKFESDRYAPAAPSAPDVEEGRVAPTMSTAEGIAATSGLGAPSEEAAPPVPLADTLAAPSQEAANLPEPTPGAPPARMSDEAAPHDLVRSYENEGEREIGRKAESAPRVGTELLEYKAKQSERMSIESEQGESEAFRADNAARAPAPALTLPAAPAPTPPAPAEVAQSAPQAEEPEMPRLAPRGSGEMAVVTAARTLRYRDGVWIQSEYRDEPVTELQRDTEAWKRLKERDPGLIDFEALEAPVVFRAFEVWYRLDVPKGKD